MNSAGRRSLVTVRPISTVKAGNEARKSFVEATVHSQSGREKTLELFLKTYNRLDPRSAGEVMATHTKLKQLDLPVVDTLRISEDGQNLLMSEITEGGKFEILDIHNTNPVTKVRNREQLKEELEKVRETARSNGLIFTPDAYAIAVDKVTGIGKLLLVDLGTGVLSRETNRKYYLLAPENKTMSYEQYEKNTVEEYSSFVTYFFLEDH